jgi:hypothetical protein
MVSPKPLSVFVPDVTLIAFPIPRRETRAVAEHFPHANRRSLRVKKMILILIVRAQFRCKPEFALVRSNLRRFRRLFAAAQSTAAPKLANLLNKQGFLV